MPLTDSAKRDAVARLLGWPDMARSDRSAALLAYLADAAIEGRELTPYAIAFDVFERDETFDPSSDPLVRVAMARLRRMLQDYAEGAGADDPVIVRLPRRSYALEFEGRAAAATPTGGDVTLAVTAAPEIPPEPVEAATGDGRRPRRRGVVAGVLAALAVIAVAAVAVPSLWRDEAQPIPASEMPIIAVLPFSNLTGDARLNFLGTGIQQQIAADLWRFRTLRVMPVYDPEALRRAEGRTVYGSEGTTLDFVLTGSIMADDDAISIATSLRDSRTNRALWRQRTVETLDASNYTGLLQSVSRTVSAEVGLPRGALGEDILSTLGEEIGLGTGTMDSSYICLLRYSSLAHSASLDSYNQTRGCLSEILEREPENVQALAAVAWLDAFSTDPAREYYVPGNLAARRAAALSQVRRAVSIDPGSDFVQTHLGLVHWINGNEDEALASFRRAIELNPNNPEPMADFGLFACISGRCDEGLPWAWTALNLLPDPPVWFYTAPSVDAILRGAYDEALRFALSLDRGADVNDCAYVVAAAALAGRIGEAVHCADQIDINRARFAGDPLGGSRFWVRDEELISILERGIARSGF